jgi:hypothetical protein
LLDYDLEIFQNLLGERFFRRSRQENEVDNKMAELDKEEEKEEGEVEETGQEENQGGCYGTC